MARSVVVFAVSALLIPQWAVAAEWSSTSGVTFTQVYTDNSDLSEDDEDSRFTSLITPNFSLEGSGARANVDISGTLQFSDAGGQTDNFNPNVNASADAELIEDFLFIETDASARQTSIDPFARSGSVGISDTDNSTTTYDYGVTAYISSRFKNYFTYELRYNYDDQINDDREVDDSTQDAASFNLNSGSYFGRFSWDFSVDYRGTEFEDDAGNVALADNSDNEFISADVGLGYRFSRKWEVTASVGKEWNDFQSESDDVDGDIWNAGVIWTPNARATINFGYGERFFGSTPSLDVSYRHKRSELNVSYSRSSTDSRDIRSQSGGGNLSNFSNLTSRTNNTIVDERLDFSYTLTGRRTTLSIDGDRSKQTSEDSGVENIFSGYAISVDRSLAPNLSLTLSYSWDEREDGDSSNTIQTDDYVVSLTRRLSENANLSLNYNHSDRDSDQIGDDYIENRISVSVSVTH